MLKKKKSSLRENEKDIGQKFRPTQRREEHQRMGSEATIKLLFFLFLIKLVFVHNDSNNVSISM